MVNNSTAKTKHVRTKLTMVQKVACHEKFVKLTNALTTAQDAYQEEARAIAQEHGRSLKWTCKQLHMGKGIFNKCRMNPWNAFVRQEMNEYNKVKGRRVGDHLKLPVFITEHCAQLTSSYFCLMMAEKNCLQDNVEMLRQSHIKWTTIQAQTGIEGIYLVVHGNVEQYHEPKLFCMPKVASFIKDVLGMELKRFALKLKSWVVGDFTFIDKTHIILATTKPSCKKKVMMNYDNYKQKIVKTYTVALQNYLLGDVQNPGKIGCCEDLMKLLDSLVNTTCLRVKLTEDEVA
ncbi:hypothetical protein EDB19DRAFT_1836913 [Suillus lakei]|nr:hypothetical protein EDB19DRAFT_1836913 [Suillus lakei]